MKAGHCYYFPLLRGFPRAKLLNSSVVIASSRWRTIWDPSLPFETTSRQFGPRVLMALERKKDIYLIIHIGIRTESEKFLIRALSGRKM